MNEITNSCLFEWGANDDVCVCINEPMCIYGREYALCKLHSLHSANDDNMNVETTFTTIEISKSSHIQ